MKYFYLLSLISLYAHAQEPQIFGKTVLADRPGMLLTDQLLQPMAFLPADALPPTNLLTKLKTAAAGLTFLS